MAEGIAGLVALYDKDGRQVATAILGAAEDGSPLAVLAAVPVDENARPVRLLTEETGQAILKRLDRLVELMAELAGELP